MEENKTVSIDLGTRKIGVSVAERGEDGKIRLIYYNDDFPSDGINHGKVVNPRRLGAALKKAIEDSERFLKVKFKDAMVNIQKYGIREISVDASMETGEGHCIGPEDIDLLEDMVWGDARSQGAPDEEVFGIVPQSFDAGNEWGVGADDITGMMAASLCGHYKAYIGKTNCRNNIDAAFAEAGLVSVKTVFAPEATGRSVLKPMEMEEGVALLDIGAGSSSVSIFYNKTMRHYGAIPFGGNNITADIRSMCGIDDRLAENIKLGYGGLMPDKLSLVGEKTLKITDVSSGDRTEITAKYLSEIITARMREILDALLYEIQLSGYADRLKSGVVVCGGCAGTMNICNMIKEISGYNARIGAPLRQIFDADSTFFTAGAAELAGLTLRFTAGDHVNCTEDDGAEPVGEELLTEIFPTDNINEREERQRRKEEEKRQKKERKEEERRRKEEESRKRREENRPGVFGNVLGKFNDTLFGTVDEQENQL